MKLILIYIEKSYFSKVFFSKFDAIDSGNQSRRPANNRDPNSNSRANGFNDEPRQELQTGDQKWYTHVERSQNVQEQRYTREAREERPSSAHKYKVSNYICHKFCILALIHGQCLEIHEIERKLC